MGTHEYVVERLKQMTLKERRVLAAEADVSFWTINKYAYEQISEPSGVKLERLERALKVRDGANV